ncbi:MAG: DUF222 domain-containing protein, partial [Actinomycetia bacterium]|nr:DUF222 domain-containing protein [Actinomycetes bacterium]
MGARAYDRHAHVAGTPVSAAPVESPVLPRAEGAASPLASVVGVLERAHAVVQELFEATRAAGPDQSVSDTDLAAVVAAAASLERGASALGVASVAGYARREAHDDPDTGHEVMSIRARGYVNEWAPNTLSHVLRISSRSAQARVSRAADLASVMPHCLAVVAAGHVELWQIEKALAELRAAGADDETIREVDAWLAPRLEHTDPTRIPTLTRYGLGRIRPDLLPTEAKKQREVRALEVWECAPGVSELTARVPTEKAAAIWEAATVLGKQYRAADPALTLDQARCDAFVDLLLADVAVTAHVTLGVPIVTSAYAAIGEAPMPPRDPADPGPDDSGEHLPTDDHTEHAHPDAATEHAHPDD